MIKRRSKRFKIALGGAGLLILAAALAIGIHIVRGKRRADKDAVQLSTMILTRMDLMNSISATGTVRGRQTRSVTARITGLRVRESLVSVGDQVMKGERLVRFNRSDLKEELADAREVLADARSSGDQEIASAQSQYDKAVSDQSYDSSRMNTRVAEADSRRITAQAAVDRARDKVDKLQGSKDQQKKTAAQEALARAKEDYEQAVSAVTEAEENRISTNRQNESAVSQARTSLENARTNAEKNIREAKRQVDAAKRELKKCVVKAPIDGIVTAVNVQSGDVYSGGALMQIDDTSVYTVTMSVDEYDISQVAVGQRVVILTETTGQDQLEGEITFIAPSTDSASSGSTAEESGTADMSDSSSGGSYEVKVQIMGTDPRLRLGLTARCSIVLEEARNVLAVPYDAISEREDGSSYITVIDGVTAPVSTGSAVAAGSAAPVPSEPVAPAVTDLGSTPDAGEGEDFWWNPGRATSAPEGGSFWGNFHTSAPEGGSFWNGFSTSVPDPQGEDFWNDPVTSAPEAPAEVPYSTPEVPAGEPDRVPVLPGGGIAWDEPDDQPSEQEESIWEREGVEQLKNLIQRKSSLAGQDGDVSGQDRDVSGQDSDPSGQDRDVSGQGSDPSGQDRDVSGQGSDPSGQDRDVSGQDSSQAGQSIDLIGQVNDLTGRQDGDPSGQGSDPAGQDGYGAGAGQEGFVAGEGYSAAGRDPSGAFSGTDPNIPYGFSEGGPEMGGWQYPAYSPASGAGILGGQASPAASAGALQQVMPSFGPFTTENCTTRQIAVTKGMESDYYVEIFGNELVEGLLVVLPADAVPGSTPGDDGDERESDIGVMGGGMAPGDMGDPRGGNRGGHGSAPGGGD